MTGLSWGFPGDEQEQSAVLGDGGGAFFRPETAAALGVTERVPAGATQDRQAGVESGPRDRQRLSQIHKADEIVAAALSVEPSKSLVELRCEVEFQRGGLSRRAAAVQVRH